MVRFIIEKASETAKSFKQLLLIQQKCPGTASLKNDFLGN